MSTEMRTRHPSYKLLRFWGGDARGTCICISMTVTGQVFPVAVNMDRYAVKQFIAGCKVGGTFYNESEEMLQLDHNTPMHMSVRRFGYLQSDLSNWLLDRLEELY
jgi:hypothetical protein